MTCMITTIYVCMKYHCTWPVTMIDYTLTEIGFVFNVSSFQIMVFWKQSGYPHTHTHREREREREREGVISKDNTIRYKKKKL